MADDLPEPWTLTASAFNWTPDVLRAERSTHDIAVGIPLAGVASVIELEAGQAWRSFPAPDADDVSRLREGLSAAGGSVSIVGVSIDDWASALRRRSDDERLEFLSPQLTAARLVGAHGVRLPIGQAGPALLQRLLPVLHDLDLVLYEEVQGQQTPDNPAYAAAYANIAEIADPRVRILVDMSMFMPSLPPSYLTQLAGGGVPARLVDALSQDWRSADTHAAVVAALRSGQVPGSVHTLFMNLLVRFGRSDTSLLRDLLPYTTAFHLKFWDLDDSDARVSGPIGDLGGLLRETGFAGTLCSEWGGHEWLEGEDATDITRRHLALARAALS